MTQGSYNQFCPVAMAAEILCTRWTVVLLRELVAGSTRFNDLRRGVPRMSPALLSKRLKDLEDAGIVIRVASRTEPGVLEYHLTPAGRELEGVIMAIGKWGQHWVEAQLSLENLDPSLLMWDMRRNLDPTPMPDRRCVIQFIYPEQPSARRYWWLVIEPDADVDLCSVDPGFRRRSLRQRRSAHDDYDLDGPDQCRRFRRQGKTDPDRRPRARPRYADVAGPEPVRQREEARDGVRSRRGAISAPAYCPRLPRTANRTASSAERNRARAFATHSFCSAAGEES